MRKVLMVVFSLCAAGAQADTKATQALWEGKCATCHGMDGKGRPNIAKMYKIDPDKFNLTKHAAKEKTETLVKTIANGKDGKMPAFKDKLKPEEINALTAYVQSLGSTK